MQFNSKQIISGNKKRTERTPVSQSQDMEEDIDVLLFFENLGCSITNDSDKNYDLTTTSDVTPNKIDNPYISDDKVVKNKKVTTNNSFANENDPFYELASDSDAQKAAEEANKRMSANAAKTKKLKQDLSAALKAAK